MAKIGRNDPCPCGSGQKYKRCCLPRDEAAAVERARAAEYYRKAADFVHARPESYDPVMEIYLRKRAIEFGAPAD